MYKYSPECRNKYKKYIAKRFWKNVVGCENDLAVIELFWKPFDIALLKSGELSTIEPSVFCGLGLPDEKYTPLLIPQKKYPRLTKILLTYEQALNTGQRNPKYLSLFKVYETICQKPQIRYASLRHALAHSAEVLNRPQTVQTLMENFGTIEIDLSKYKHQTMFWCIYGELLVLVDGLIATMLLKVKEDVIMPKNYQGPITSHVAQWEYPEEYRKLFSMK